MIFDHPIFSYQKATQIELNDLKDWCAICWEQMDSARKLPCNHFFHEWYSYAIALFQKNELTELRLRDLGDRENPRKDLLLF